MNSLLQVLIFSIVTGALAVPSMKARIVGGRAVTRNEYPMVVSVQTCLFSGSPCWHSCGGAIISTHMIVTAARCIPLPIYRLKIAAGGVNLNNSSQSIFVSSYKIYPEYHSLFGRFQAHDIALLFLENNLTFTPQVQPVGLPASGSTPTGIAYFTGWGSSSPGDSSNSSNTLQTVQSQIIDISTCKDLFLEVNPLIAVKIDYSRHVCTTFAVGVSSCEGDQGGPLVSNNQLIGVSSINSCGRAEVSVYTRVSSFVNWIMSEM